MGLDHELVDQIIQRGIEAGLSRKFEVACAVVDADGRTRQRHPPRRCAVGYPGIRRRQSALGECISEPTRPMFALQKERPLYGATIAGLNASNQWFLAEGGAAIKIKDASGKDKCVGAIGVSGCFPATIDQEIDGRVVAWVTQQLDKK